ncbi:MAG: rhomboid family protein [Verrucomicrobiota bacterium]|nr:rhomboid family protein [Verrucomicrobiota bacterium]
MPKSIPLSSSRCFYHGSREAVARCPECTRFYCRECISEHDDKVICSTCLTKAKVAAKKRSHTLLHFIRPIVAVTGFIFSGIVFYMLGQSLLRIPTAFHEGTVWNLETLFSDEK